MTQTLGSYMADNQRKLPSETRGLGLTTSVSDKAAVGVGKTGPERRRDAPVRR